MQSHSQMFLPGQKELTQKYKYYNWLKLAAYSYMHATCDSWPFEPCKSWCDFLCAPNFNFSFSVQYVVVDFLWYRKLEAGASVWSAGHDLIDEWGRPMPDPDRWPSSRNGSGFTEVAQQVHAMGLKFGIHVMRGISTAAVNANSPILGAKVGMTWTLVSLSGFEFSDLTQCTP